MFDKILEYAQDKECSDVHLVTRMPPIVRSVGKLIRLDITFDIAELDEETVMEWIDLLTNDDQMKQYRHGEDVDTGYTDKYGNRYRVNVYRQQGVPAIAIRLLKNEIPTIDSLRLPQILKQLAMMPRGLVLLTGPTGVGKSTTLAAMIDYININKQQHILTIEDPIEYVHKPKNCLINQREVHKDVSDFLPALRSALREDPDVILVGEMRDYQTISLALTAAETGHLVLSTLHTTGAAQTIDRIIDVFPPHQQAQIRTQLAGVLKGVVSQLLIPVRDNTARIAVHEIMIMTEAIANLIRENKIFQINSSIQTGIRHGMQTLEGGLAKLVNEGEISLESAMEYAGDHEFLKRLL